MTVFEPGVAPDADAEACNWGNRMDTRAGGSVMGSDVEGPVCEVKCCRNCVTSSYVKESSSAKEQFTRVY